MEKIVRDYFPYITETETTTFTDCVKCLITFTHSRFNSDASLNAIAFLRFCAVKLAEGGLVCYNKNTECHPENRDSSDGNNFSDKDDHVYFWVPLLAGIVIYQGLIFLCLVSLLKFKTVSSYMMLTFLHISGLSKLTSDPRPTIRKGALEVLFDILKDHGHLFSCTFWNNIFKSVIYPIFSNARSIPDGQVSPMCNSEILEEDSWSSETDAVAAQCLVDLFVKFFDDVRSQLAIVAAILTSFVTSSYPQSASIGVATLLHLTGHLGSKLSDMEWKGILLHLKEAAALLLPVFSRIVRIMQSIEIPDKTQAYSDAVQYSDHEFVNDEEDANMETASYATVRLKSHIAVQLMVVQVR